jgi:hypothetical protein
MKTDDTAVYAHFDNGRPLDAEDIWTLERLAAVGDGGLTFDEWYDAVVPHLFDKNSFIPRLCKLMNRGLATIKGRRGDGYYVYAATPQAEAQIDTEVWEEFYVKAVA